MHERKLGVFILPIRAKVIKLFSCSTLLSMKFPLLIEIKMLKNNIIDLFMALKLSDVVFILLNCWHFNIYRQDKSHAQLSLV